MNETKFFKKNIYNDIVKIKTSFWEKLKIRIFNIFISDTQFNVYIEYSTKLENKLHKSFELVRNRKKCKLKLNGIHNLDINLHKFYALMNLENNASLNNV